MTNLETISAELRDAKERMSRHAFLELLEELRDLVEELTDECEAES